MKKFLLLSLLSYILMIKPMELSDAVGLKDGDQLQKESCILSLKTHCLNVILEQFQPSSNNVQIVNHIKKISMMLPDELKDAIKNELGIEKVLYDLFKTSKIYPHAKLCKSKKLQYAILSKISTIRKPIVFSTISENTPQATAFANEKVVNELGVIKGDQLFPLKYFTYFDSSESTLCFFQKGLYKAKLDHLFLDERSSISMSFDKKFLACIDGNEIYVWNVKKNALLKRIFFGLESAKFRVLNNTMHMIVVCVDFLQLWNLIENETTHSYSWAPTDCDRNSIRLKIQDDSFSIYTINNYSEQLKNLQVFSLYGGEKLKNQQIFEKISSDDYKYFSSYFLMRNIIRPDGWCFDKKSKFFLLYKDNKYSIINRQLKREIPLSKKLTYPSSVARWELDKNRSWAVGANSRIIAIGDREITQNNRSRLVMNVYDVQTGQFITKFLVDNNYSRMSRVIVTDADEIVARVYDDSWLCHNLIKFSMNTSKIEMLKDQLSVAHVVLLKKIFQQSPKLKYDDPLMRYAMQSMPQEIKEKLKNYAELSPTFLQQVIQFCINPLHSFDFTNLLGS